MNRKTVWWALALTMLLTVSAAVSGHVALQSFTVVSTGPANAVFTAVGAQGSSSAQGIDAVWPVTINLALLSTLPASVVLNFPDRASVTLTRVRSQQRGDNAFLWTGRGSDCSAMLRQAPSSFRGEISCLNASYEISVLQGASGLQLIRAAMPSLGSGADVVANPPPLLASSQSQPVLPAVQTPDTSIDILVLYTEAVRGALDPAGGNINTTLLARDSVDLTQMAMDNSTTPPGPPTVPSIALVNFVAAVEVLRTANGNLANDLLYLQGDPEAVGIRNFWAADVVMYFTDYGGVAISGLANEPSYNNGTPPPGPGFAYLAEAALQYNCAMLIAGTGCVDNYVFPHEFGHIFGANHDTGNTDNSTPVEPWAYGHWANGPPSDGGGNRTIMSYRAQCASPCPHVLNYSNSQVTVSTFHTGILNQQENARVIAQFAPDTAQYRVGLGRIFYNGFEEVQ